MIIWEIVYDKFKKLSCDTESLLSLYHMEWDLFGDYSVISLEIRILISYFLVVDKSIDLVIPAHDTEVGAIAVNPDGTLIASASERGHIIKIYSTDAGEVVQELKRGNSKADIESILFHPHQYILACTSSK